MKPSAAMLSSPAYAALGSSARSVLRIAMEEIGAAGGAAVQLSTIFFVQAGMAPSAAQSGISDLVLLGFVRVTGTGTTARTFSLSDDWLAIDQAEAERRLAAAREARATKLPARRPRAASTVAAAVDAGGRRPLPEGIRRAVWPQLTWEGGER